MCHDNAYNNPMSEKRERHVRLGHYLRDIIFAANDGLITTFAVVAGVVGAALSPLIVLIIGFTSLIADGFAMAAGNYLGTKSEKDLYKKEENIERQEIISCRDRELEEIRTILKNKGFAGEKLETMVGLISSNEQYWVDFMMYEELGLFLPEVNYPIRHATATFVSFITVGSIPLLPYLLLTGDHAFVTSAAISAATLFTVGALRKFYSNRSWFMSGLEMLFIGGLASGIAYLTGFLLKSITSF